MFDLGAMGLYAFWSTKLQFPFLFEITLAILLLRELPRWSLEKTAVVSDGMFRLKDRLYSYVWYLHHPKVPEKIRTAQLREISSSMDLESQVRSVKIKIPVTLFAAIPLFAAFLYMSWNAEYVPPGITTRIITLSKLPAIVHPPAAPLSTAAGPEDRSSGAGSAPAGTDLPEGMDPDHADENLAAANRSGETSTSVPGGIPGEDPSAQSQGAPGESSSGAGGNAPGLKGADPDSLTSNPVSATASAPIPPNLAEHATQSFLELPDATKFLDLVPGQGTGSLADLDEETISLFEDNVENYPDRYREHLQNYYWELKKWSQSSR